MSQSLEEKIDTCMMLLRSIVAVHNRRKPVLEWELNKMSQRFRQRECRSRKAAENDKRPANPESHCLHKDFNTSQNKRAFLYSEPTGSDTMMHFLRTELALHNPVAWFVYKVRESARDALTFLFCLYNNCFQQKWIKNSGPPYTIFRGWETGSPRTPDWRRDVTKSTVFPSKVPKGEWTLQSREAYSASWCWKVFAVVYNFLQDFILEAEEFENSEDAQINHFLATITVMSEFSTFEVLPGKFWDPVGICRKEDWSENDAKRACHLVAPQLAILTETFRKGINRDITQYFAE